MCCSLVFLLGTADVQSGGCSMRSLLVLVIRHESVPRAGGTAAARSASDLFAQMRWVEVGRDLSRLPRRSTFISSISLLWRPWASYEQPLLKMGLGVAVPEPAVPVQGAGHGSVVQHGAGCYCWSLRLGDQAP